MSVSERIKQMRQQEEEKRRVELEKARKIEEAEKEKHRLYLEKLEQELPAQRDNQLVLLRELDSLGIIDMVQDGTNLPVWLWDSGLNRSDLPVYGLLNWQQELKWFGPVNETTRARFVFAPRRYEVRLLGPRLDSHWDYSVVIKISERNNQRSEFAGGLEEEFRGISQIKYTPEKILTITGEKEYFNDPIPMRKAQRVQLIEGAIAQALVNPLKPERQEYGNPDSDFWNTPIA